MALPEEWRSTVRAIAEEGLAQTASDHDRGRYDQLTKIVTWPSGASHQDARIAASLEGVAKCGLGFTSDDADRQRFATLAEIALECSGGSQFIAATPHPLDLSKPVTPFEISAQFTTPRLSVSVIVLDSDSRLLMIQRGDTEEWALPAGMADLGCSATEVGVKEVHEEAGIEVRIDGLLGIVDELRHGSADSLVAEWQVVLKATAIGGELRPSPVECLDARWFSLDELPPREQLSSQGEPWVSLARAAADDRRVQFLDPPRPLVVDLTDAQEHQHQR